MGRKLKLLEARVTTLEAKCEKLEEAVRALTHAFDRGRGGAAAAKAAKKAAIIVPMPIRPNHEPPEQRTA